MDFTADGSAPRKSLVGIGIVVFLHVVLIYALLTGLARKVVDVIQQPVETKLIEEFKPPPPPPPPPPKQPPPKQLTPPPPSFVPPPEVKVEAPPPENVIASVTTVAPPTNELPPPAAQPAPVVEKAPEPPPPPIVPVRTSAKLAGHCEKPEYPKRSLQDGEEGTVTIKLTISAEGNVVNAIVEKSSGFSKLDNATLKAWSLCHFTPAITDGQAVQSEKRLQYVWKLN